MSEVGSEELDGLRHGFGDLPDLETARARLDEWQSRAGGSGEPAYVHALLVGLLRFDAVNLAHGAAVGDGALAEVASRMSHFAAVELDGPWLVARSGGGNFLLIANEACSRERWQLFAEEVADVIAKPIAVPAGLLRLSPRMALLRCLTDESVESILDRLGQALVQAKRTQGRRPIWADGEATEPGRSSAELEADLLGAIDRDEIEIFYQPQFSLPEERITGGEALARWNHPQLGRIGAGALFAIAERADHVAPLSRHIAKRALEGARVWPAGLRLSLNVTPADLATGSYYGELIDLVEASGFDAARLTLEVTEQALLYDVELAARILAGFSARGIRIALDDFGAGFCNFRYLKLLPLHYLKLDRSMIEGLAGDARDLAILRAIVAMAGVLDLEVIAEGIESEAQRNVAAQEGCAFYQGFLRAPPLDAAAFHALVSAKTETG